MDKMKFRINWKQLQCLKLADMPAWGNQAWFPKHKSTFKNRRFPSIRYIPFALWATDDYTSDTYNVVDGFRLVANMFNSKAACACISPALKVAIYGDSVVFGQYSPDFLTISSSLVPLLDCYPAKVVDRSATGYTIENSLHLFVSDILEGCTSRVIFVFFGINEVLTSLEDTPHSFFPLFDLAKPKSFQKVIEILLCRGQDKILSIINLFLSKQLGCKGDSFSINCTPLPSDFESKILRSINRSVNSLKLFNSLTYSLDKTVIPVLLPNIFAFEGPLNKDEISVVANAMRMHPSIDKAFIGYARGVADSLNVENIDFLDLNAELSSLKLESHYFLDICHLSPDAHQDIATLLAAKISF